MPQLIEKPLPRVTELNRGVWEATRAGQLKLQRCVACQHIRYPISATCPECLSSAYEWHPLSGKGSVFSYVTFHQVYHPSYKDDVPYNVSIIQLIEGPRLISNVIDIPPHEVSVGQFVEVCFDEITPEIKLPRFRPLNR